MEAGDCGRGSGSLTWNHHCQLCSCARTPCNSLDSAVNEAETGLVLPGKAFQGWGEALPLLRCCEGAGKRGAGLRSSSLCCPGRDRRQRRDPLPSLRQLGQGTYRCSSFCLHPACAQCHSHTGTTLAGSGTCVHIPRCLQSTHPHLQNMGCSSGTGAGTGAQPCLATQQ